MNVDGTITVFSMSYFGQGNADEYFRKQWAAIDEHNRKALEIWNTLTDVERAERIKKFEEERVELPRFL